MPNLPPPVLNDLRTRALPIDAVRRDRAIASDAKSRAGVKGARGAQAGEQGAEGEDFSKALSRTLGRTDDRAKPAEERKEVTAEAPEKAGETTKKDGPAKSGDAKPEDAKAELPKADDTDDKPRVEVETEKPVVDDEALVALKAEPVVPELVQPVAMQPKARAAQAKPVSQSGDNGAAAVQTKAKADADVSSDEAQATDTSVKSKESTPKEQAAPASVVEFKPTLSSTEDTSFAAQSEAEKVDTAKPAAARREVAAERSDTPESSAKSATNDSVKTPSARATEDAPHDAQPQPLAGSGSIKGSGTERTDATTGPAPQTGGTAPRSTEMSQLESLVSRGLSASLAQRGGTLTMRLMPDSLGAMRIQMDVQQGVVQVSMDVGNPQAHRLLTESLDTLRTSLEARGLLVEKLGVTLTPTEHGSVLTSGASGGAGGFGGNTSPGTGDSSAQRQDANGQFSHHDAGDGRSRSWLGGDQRQQQRPGGAGPHVDDHTDAKDESFGGLWQRLRLGVDTRV